MGANMKKKIMILSILIFISFFLSFSIVYCPNTKINTQQILLPTAIDFNNLYEYYSNLDRPVTNDYALYVMSPYDKYEISKIAENLSFEEIRDLDFIEYKEDMKRHGINEYPQYPIETIYLGTGDCEDKAILQCALLMAKGYDTTLIRVPDHITAGFYDNDSLVWLHPFENSGYSDNDITFHMVNDRPILTIEGDYSSNLLGHTFFTLFVSNYGSKTVTNCILSINDDYKSEFFTINSMETKRFYIKTFITNPKVITITSNNKVMIEHVLTGQTE